VKPVSLRFRRCDQTSRERRRACAVPCCNGNALTAGQDSQFVVLEWTLGRIGGEALVMRRELERRGPILLLPVLRIRAQLQGERHGQRGILG
jgi:hypothetical protein